MSTPALPSALQQGMSLAGRHALVTGAGRGIGAAIAAQLAALGARVSLLGRDVTTLEQTAAQLPQGFAQTQACDITEPASVALAFEKARAAFGPITLLVNNAGQAVSAPFARTTLAQWQAMLDVNLTGTFLCTQAALPDMLEARFGRIVNVVSTAGQRGYAYVAAYVAAKHGVVGLTRALALEFATKGITVNAVCPGYTDTDIVRNSVANVVQKTGRSAEEALAEFVKSNPQGRLVAPAEVAGAVAYLCGAGAASVTGQCLGVAGGEVM